MNPTAGFGRPQRQSRYGLQVGIASDASCSRHEAENGLEERLPCIWLRHERPGNERPNAALRDRLGIVRIGLVQNECADQALVTVCYLPRVRAAREAREHR